MAQGIKTKFHAILDPPPEESALLTALTTLTIAVGIAGPATMFSIVNAVLLLPLPVLQPNQLYWIKPAPFPFRTEIFKPRFAMISWGSR